MARILVVEDERVLAKNVREKLAAHGHEVRIAHSGREATAANAEFLPEVVFLDLRLPDTDGLKILPQLKAESPFTNVVVVTAHGNERIAVDAMKAVNQFPEPSLSDSMRILHWGSGRDGGAPSRATNQWAKRTSGSIRSAQRGSHQARSPAR